MNLYTQFWRQKVRPLIFAQINSKNEIVFEYDNLKQMPDSFIINLKNMYQTLVYEFVKEQIKNKKGEIKSEEK